MRNKNEKKEELRREGAFFSSFGFAKEDLGVYLRFLSAFSHSFCFCPPFFLQIL
jgi:hypothetical protein